MDTAITGHTMRGGAQAPPPSFFRLANAGLANLLVVGGSAGSRSRIARQAHDLSPLARGPFVAVSAAWSGFVEALLPLVTQACSELDSPIQRADGGTLFVDDVDRLDPDAQRLFFEFLRRGRSEGPHDTRWAGRIVVGASRDLGALVTRGEFMAPLLDTLDKIRVDIDAISPSEAIS